MKSRVAPTDGLVVDDSFDVERDYFIEAKPLGPLIPPAYPPRALSGKAGLVTVGVKVSIDAEGRVTDVSPSMLVFSTPTRYSKEFQEAVQVAVRRWRFHPAQRSRPNTRQTTAEERRAPEFHWENTDTYLDLSFTFTASGTVLPGASIK